MRSAGAHKTLRGLAGVLDRRKRIVIAAVLLTTSVAVGLMAFKTPIYRASADVRVEPSGQDELSENQDVNVDGRAVRTEIQLIESRVVRERVQTDLGLADLPPPANASAAGDTDVISIAVRDTEAIDAATFAGAYAAAYIEVRREDSVDELLAASAEVQTAIDELQAELDDLGPDDPSRVGMVSQLADLKIELDQLQADAALPPGGAVVIKPAEVPGGPVEPTPVRTSILAAVIGLFIGLGVAFLVDLHDHKVRSEDDLALIVAKPVLAVVPIHVPPDDRPIAVSLPRDEAVEAYRRLRTNVQFLAIDQLINVIQITSSITGEGKTTTSANLAVMFAQAGHHVALVDADLHHPRIHGVFGLTREPGLTDILLGAQASQTVNHIQVDGGRHLSVYTSGIITSNPSELLSGHRIHRLLEAMGKHFDYVIVDSAAVLPVSDSVTLAGAVDGVIVVAQAARVTEDDVAATTERLERVSAPLLGYVLNRATQASGRDQTPGGLRPHSAVTVRGDQPTEAPAGTTTTRPVAD